MDHPGKMLHEIAAVTPPANAVILKYRTVIHFTGQARFRIATRGAAWIPIAELQFRGF